MQMRIPQQTTWNGQDTIPETADIPKAAWNGQDTIPETADIPIKRAKRRTIPMTFDEPRNDQAPNLSSAAALSTADLPAAARPARSGISAGSRIGKYELIRELGRGGMGSVHLARDLRLGRLVAIKFLTHESGHVSEQFLVEARATARCHHTHIVVIHDVGEHAGCPYMVLEYLEGRTLRQWLREQAPLESLSPSSALTRAPMSSRRAIDVVLPVVQALVRAHEMGIVHRDLKPENIMITDAGTIKVLDFGIAGLLADSDIETPHAGSSLAMSIASGFALDAMVGTLAYMSPEQLNGERVDHRADIWAIGIILFELVAGHRPMPALSAGDLIDLADLDEAMPSVSVFRPEIGPLAGIIDRCLLKDRARRTADAQTLLDELEAQVPSRRALELTADQCPFAGLAAFQESDADRFYGRDQAITEITSRLRSQPLVAVAGVSGIGKSSLVRAGVIPALKRSGDGWSAHVIRPGRQPLDALVDILDQIVHSSSSSTNSISGFIDAANGIIEDSIRSLDLRQRLQNEPGYFGAELRAWALGKQRRVLVFIDQFEELCTLCDDPDEIATFLACLDGAADDASSPLRVVLSMRSDFLDRLAEHRSFMAQVSRSLLFLPPLSREGLRESLVCPLEAVGYRYESQQLVDKLLDQVADIAGALPLLQFTASQLWANRDQKHQLLTWASYMKMGGLAGALASHADQVLISLNALERDLARAIFERLITPERTRNIAEIDELRLLGGNPDDCERVLQHLIDARLLTTDTQADSATVELVHESLIERWPTLALWLNENQGDAAFLARLRTAATDWERSGRAQGLLWRGGSAREAEFWNQRAHKRPLIGREHAYLGAVLALLHRTVRIKRLAIVGSIAFLVLLLIAATFTITESRRQNQLVARQVHQLQAQELELKDAAKKARTAAEAEAAARSEAEERSEQERAAKEEARLAEAEAAAASRKEKDAREVAEGALRRARRARRKLRKALDAARSAETVARAAREQAEQAAEQQRKAREDLERLVARAIGPVNMTLSL